MLKMVDVDDSLGGAILALKGAQADTQEAMRAEADAAITTSWVPALAAAASTAQQTKLLVSGAGADVTDVGFDLTAAAGGALSGGLAASHWYAVDYGMTPKQITAPKRQKTIRRKVYGGTFAGKIPATIWVGRNLPARNSAGRVVYPTIGEQSQIYVKAWVTGLMGQFDDGPLDVDSGKELGQVAGSWQ